MWTETYRAKKVTSSGRYQIDGFTAPLRSPTIIFETDDVSKDFNIGLIAEDYRNDDPANNPYNASHIHRGDFYRLASRELKSRHTDIYKFDPRCYPILNTMKPTLPAQVEFADRSVVMLAFAGDGTHRAWLYVENFKEV